MKPSKKPTKKPDKETFKETSNQTKKCTKDDKALNPLTIDDVIKNCP